jgi:hypothetical protein
MQNGGSDASVFVLGRGKPMADLEDEAARLTDLLRGKIIKAIGRHRPDEMLSSIMGRAYSSTDSRVA